MVEKFVLPARGAAGRSRRHDRALRKAAKWLAETGYDEKFGARPLARVIQEHIKKPLADELLFGKLEHGGTVRVLVTGEGEGKKLTFDYLPADPKPKKAKSEGEDDDSDEDEEGGGARRARLEAAPRKALPGPRDKKERFPKSGGAVPSVPRRKPD